MMKNDFDFEKIGKKIPYSVPDRFFEDITKTTLEKARLRERKIKIRKLLVLYSSAASVLILIAIGFLLMTGKQIESETAIVQSVTEEKILQDIQPEEIFKTDTVKIQINAEPEIQSVAQDQENSVEELIAGMSGEELQELEIIVNSEIFLEEIINN